jgi:hypothetical protein
VRQGYADPLTDRVYQALDAVDRARRRAQAAAPPSMRPSPPVPRPLTPAEIQHVSRVLVQQFGAIALPKTMPKER